MDGIAVTVRAIIPTGGTGFDASIAKKAIVNAMNGAAKAAKVDFDVTTQTWNNRPVFTIVAPTPFERQVMTDNEIYGYVDEGTKPHIIVPRTKKALAFFAGGYKAKTRVRVIGSKAGGSPPGINTIVPIVHHPGTDAREFSQAIEEKWNDRLPEILQRAIDALGD
jgi:hypothetical protein